jgi:glycine dehydrogenase
VKHDALAPSDTFLHRHIGPRPADVEAMLKVVGAASLDALVAETIPESIRRKEPIALDGIDDATPRGEHEVLETLRKIARENRPLRSCIGQGYHDTITPPVILRNVLENPGFYTQYTPYQAEIAQGRLEALLNFQTMVSDLTALPLANASLLDEATAAAEAMTLCHRVARNERTVFFVDEGCHPQVIEVVRTRARPLKIEVVVGAPATAPLDRAFGAIVAYPTTDGRVEDHRAFVEKARAAGCLTAFATDLLALTLLVPPGELGADVAFGTTQRFGVPMGFGGPHAAFFATRAEHSRHVPGRIIGVSKDARGKPAMRLALQTREQHIRRDRATSNICTAQVLLAIVASTYAVYHGPDGLLAIAGRVRGLTSAFAAGLRQIGWDVGRGARFDTVRIPASPGEGEALSTRAETAGYALRRFDDGSVGVALDETTTRADVEALLAVFATGSGKATVAPTWAELAPAAGEALPAELARTSKFLEHPVFHAHRSETELLRYLNKLQARDLSLTTSMIPLGSCTMKLNATSEMIPVTWSDIGGMHPFAPAAYTAGYAKIFEDLERWLAQLTGFAATSLQPNSGAQGEYAGLLVVKAYHESRGDTGRDVCLIPTSAHGTNPASAILAGMRVVAVECDAKGNVSLDDLGKKAAAHAKELSCLMMTYPSTHGVFEEEVRAICDVVHQHGGQVYMDGANMNAQVGITGPGFFGADVCHLNLHKTFCIPHGGGGPGMGPICVAAHLGPFLPRTRLDDPSPTRTGFVSAAPYGSPSILVIPWMYIAMMGGAGLRRATEMAILNANYMAKRLEGDYEVLFVGERGRVAHEFILDCRPFKKIAGIEVEDIAKRLQDYGFHAPTMSFPVPGTLMIEPTESEPKSELDRFCDAMLRIREEIRRIERGELDRADNPLKNAPHTADAVCGDTWSHGYSREVAAFPAPWLRDHKYWPPVARVDNAYGDRNLICSCPPMSEIGAS